MTMVLDAIRPPGATSFTFNWTRSQPRNLLSIAVEQRQLPGIVRHLQANSNRPNVFQLERVFLADQFALVPRDMAGFGFMC